MEETPQIDLNNPPPSGSLSKRMGMPALRPTPEQLRKDRLVVVATIYHQPASGSDPTSAPDPSFFRWLETTDQPCVRRLIATEEWQPISGCWLDRAGLVTLRNDEGRFLMVQPTKEEREATAAKVLEVACAAELGANVAGAPAPPVPFAEIPPGESLPGFKPIDFTRLRVRCRQGTAKYTASVFPV